MSQFGVDSVLAMIDDLAGLPYGLEPVDQRAHALQTARLALDAGSDDELVVAALLHDIGRHHEVEDDYPGLVHEEAARRWLGRFFSIRVAWLVGAHVPAKRYLVTTDPGYFDLLSQASVVSLGEQNGPMTPDEVAEFESHPWYPDAVALRRWDDQAKVPGGSEATTDEVMRVLDRVLAGGEE